MERFGRWTWHITNRGVIAGCMIAVGLGRLGLYTFRSVTFGPGTLYGIAMIAMAVSLVLTAGPKAHTLAGRVHAGISAGLLTAMAIDVWLSVGNVNTSTVTLLWLALVLITEAGTRHAR